MSDDITVDELVALISHKKEKRRAVPSTDTSTGLHDVPISLRCAGCNTVYLGHMRLRSDMFSATTRYLQTYLCPHCPQNLSEEEWTAHLRKCVVLEKLNKVVRPLS